VSDGVSGTNRRDRGEAGTGGSGQGAREKRESKIGHRWGADLWARAAQCGAARFKPDLKQNLNSNVSNNFNLWSIRKVTS
jgi:ribosomal protein L15